MDHQTQLLRYKYSSLKFWQKEKLIGVEIIDLSSKLIVSYFHPLCKKCLSIRDRQDDYLLLWWGALNCNDDVSQADLGF